MTSQTSGRKLKRYIGLYRPFKQIIWSWKNTFKTYLTEAKQYLKLKAQLRDRIPAVEVQNKRAALLSKLEEARASVEKVEAQFDKATTSIAQAHKRRKLLEAELEQAKASKLELHGKLAETEASLKKAKDDVSFLEREITDLDATPQLTAEDIAQVEAANKRV